MYTLYYSPDACSLATHTILNMLGQDVEIVFSGGVENFAEINPAKLVPVLKDGDTFLKEGAAIILHLLDKHENNMLPESGADRQRAIENLMMANASMHPAYGRLFFAAKSMRDDESKRQFLQTAAESVSSIWRVVENQFGDTPYLGGNTPSAADILLAVYSRWGAYFPVDIHIGPKAQNMIELILSSNPFIKAQELESEDQKRYAN